VTHAYDAFFDVLLFAECFHCTTARQYFMSSGANGRKKSAKFGNGIARSMTTGAQFPVTSQSGGSGTLQLKLQRKLLFAYRLICSELMTVSLVSWWTSLLINGDHILYNYQLHGLSWVLYVCIYISIDCLLSMRILLPRTNTRENNLISFIIFCRGNLLRAKL